jgi:hypothetical protein
LIREKCFSKVQSYDKPKLTKLFASLIESFSTRYPPSLSFPSLIRSYSFCEKLQILENTFPVIKFHGHKEQIVALDLFSNQITFIKNEKDLEPIYDSILIVDAYTIDIDYLNSLNKFNNRLIFIADVHEKVPPP